MLTPEAALVIAQPLGQGVRALVVFGWFLSGHVA